MIILVFEWRPFWILPKMVDPGIFQIGSIKNMKEYYLVGLYTNFHNFCQMCKFNTLWSPTSITFAVFMECIMFIYCIYCKIVDSIGPTSTAKTIGSILVTRSIYFSVDNGLISANVDPMLYQCGSIVCDTGPILLQHYVNVSCLLGLYIINPFKPEFTIVIFIHYKPRIAVVILDF